MKKRLLTGGEAMIIKIRVKTTKPVNIRIVVSDAKRINTVFTNRCRVVSPTDPKNYFLVRLPLAPIVALLQVYDDAKGPDSTDNFTVTAIEKLPLERKVSVIDLSNPDIREFIDFAQRFCYNAGWMKPDTYGTGKLTLRYLPTIVRGDGQESATPARVGEDSGIMEVSQKIFVPFTIPMRFCILCHEFSHFYVNEDKANEIEADLQGLLIYLGLGYPRIEAYQAFSETFLASPSELNGIRYKTIHKFITDFEKQKLLIE